MVALVSLAQAFLDQMKDTVTWQTVTGIDRFRKKTLSPTTVTIKCRQTRQTRMVRNAIGEEELSGVQLILDGVYGIKPEDVITLADGSTPSIITVAQWTTALPHETVFMA